MSSIKSLSLLTQNTISMRGELTRIESAGYERNAISDMLKSLEWIILEDSSDRWNRTKTEKL